jgi:hypothetical protein
MKMVSVEMGRAATPRTAKRSMQTERSYSMGDKGGKSKKKAQKQKVAKKDQQTKKKQDKQPKSTP